MRKALETVRLLTSRHIHKMAFPSFTVEANGNKTLKRNKTAHCILYRQHCFIFRTVFLSNHCTLHSCTCSRMPSKLLTKIHSKVLASKIIHLTDTDSDRNCHFSREINLNQLVIQSRHKCNKQLYDIISDIFYYILNFLISFIIDT